MNIRPYKETDKDFIVILSSEKFDLIAWRDPQKMEEAQLK